MQIYTRRGFLGAGATAALGCSLAGCRMPFCSGGISVKGIRMAVQMWSVHDLWRKDPADSFRRLKAMGYDGVQSFGFLALDHGELEKMLDDAGLRIVDMPFYMKTVAPGSFNSYLEFCQRFGIDFVFEPYAAYPTADDWKRHADELKALSVKFAAHGIRVGYHNHQHEIRQTFAGGVRPLDILADAGLAMELDVGHVKLAGDDPLKWIRRLDGRMPSFHAKPGGGDSVGGAGDANDWQAIFSAASAAGTRWAVVECETRRNTYADVDASAKYLKTL